MTRARLSARLLCAAACGFAALASCATHMPVNTAPEPESDAYDTVVDIRFMTNRKLVQSNRGDYYGDDLGELSAGSCRVGFKDGRNRGKVLRVNTCPINTVFEDVAAGPFVIYVHGYGEYFVKNCWRAGLLQQRLGLGGRMILFSWPSSSYLTYTSDARDLERSIDELNAVLTLAAQTVGHDRIVLMAHSMGSRGIVAVLRARGEEAKFGSAIFIAPDIRRDVFIENAAMLQQKVSDITVYTSDSDRVLWLSTTVNVSGRLGVAKEFDLEHATVIDVTPTGTNDISGHLYHMLNPAVIEDLRVLLATDPADTGRAFSRMPQSTPGFWRLEPVP